MMIHETARPKGLASTTPPPFANDNRRAPASRPRLTSARYIGPHSDYRRATPCAPPANADGGAKRGLKLLAWMQRLWIWLVATHCSAGRRALGLAGLKRSGA